MVEVQPPARDGAQSASLFMFRRLVVLPSKAESESELDQQRDFGWVVARRNANEFVVVRGHPYGLPAHSGTNRERSNQPVYLPCSPVQHNV
jgi:hypothetical protein